MDGLIKFYARYLDDTLVLAKEQKIDNSIKKFNLSDKNIQFTIGRFQGGIIHFLDLKTDRSKTDLYYKTTHTGQYYGFFCQTP